MTCKFFGSLEKLADVMVVAKDGWCIFGGAAFALHGIVAEPVKDIDLIVSPCDAARLMTAYGWKNLADGGTERFRSTIIFRPVLGDMPVEILSGFQSRCGGGWGDIDIPEVILVSAGSAMVPVPTRQALALMFRACGRPKDVAKAALLELG